MPSFGNENYDGKKKYGNSPYEYAEHHSTRMNTNDRISSRGGNGGKNKLMLNTLSVVPGSPNMRLNN